MSNLIVGEDRGPVLLVTATRTETEAVLSVCHSFGIPDPEVTYGKLLTYYELGEVGRTPLSLFQCEMGTSTSGGASSSASSAIEDRDPRALVLIGIAFGLFPESQAIGDLLVSSHVRQYEIQRLGTDGEGGLNIVERGARLPASTMILGRLRHADQVLSHRGKKFFGTMLSGEKLIDNRAFRDRLLEVEPEAIGGDMESGGLVTAAYDRGVSWAVVKGICDFADGNKRVGKDEAQRRAARSAAEFMIGAIELGGFAELQEKTSNVEALLDETFRGVEPVSLVTRPHLLLRALEDENIEARLELHGLSGVQISRHVQSVIDRLRIPDSRGTPRQVTKSAMSILEQSAEILERIRSLSVQEAIWGALCEHTVLLLERHERLHGSDREWVDFIRTTGTLEGVIRNETPY